VTLALDLTREGTLAPFAAIDIVFDVETAVAALASLSARGGAYQSAAFVDAWTRAFGARLAVALARDAAGEIVAALPLHIVRRGPLRVASFAGGGWANYQFGLFRAPADWRAQDVRAFLAQAAKTVGVDLYAFMHCPPETAGVANPLFALAGTPSPSPALATRLSGSHADWLDAHFSRATQKKLRKKLKKLDVFGPVACRRADDATEARRFLDALLAQKAAQARARGEPDQFAQPAVQELLRRLIDSAALEMHALQAGERVVAAFGAMASGRRLSGLVLSHDISEDVAAATPGVQLIVEIARDAIARGFDMLDLGVGDGRYKRETCEIEEPLRDLAFGATALGRLAAPLYLGVRASMRAIKRRPALHARALAIKYALTPKR